MRNTPAAPSPSEQAARLLSGLIESVGEGHHALSVSVSGRARTAGMTLTFCNNGEFTDLDEDGAVEAMALLALTSGRPGGAIVRTMRGWDKYRVVGWEVTDCTATPIGRAELFNAYCTDADGGPIPPEPGVEYADAPPLRS